VFHCTAGKDRTGVLAALLLAVMGVGDDDIVADYALTNLALPAIYERLARDPAYGEWMVQVPASRRVAQPATMHRFLRLLEREHGGARAWLEQAGVAPASLDALRTRLRVSA
jgi:protein-tyrosine phosphatase